LNNKIKLLSIFILLASSTHIVKTMDRSDRLSTLGAIKFMHLLGLAPYGPSSTRVQHAPSANLSYPPPARIPYTQPTEVRRPHAPLTTRVPEVPSEIHNSDYQERYEAPAKNKLTGQKRKRKNKYTSHFAYTLEKTSNGSIKYRYGCPHCDRTRSRGELIVQHIKNVHDATFDIDRLERERKKQEEEQPKRKRRRTTRRPKNEHGKYTSSDEEIIRKRPRRKRKRAKRLTSYRS